MYLKLKKFRKKRRMLEFKKSKWLNFFYTLLYSWKIDQLEMKII